MEQQFVFICQVVFMCIFIVFNFVFSAVLMGIGLNLTNMHLFWLLFYSFVCKNSKLCNTY